MKTYNGNVPQITEMLLIVNLQYKSGWQSQLNFDSGNEYNVFLKIFQNHEFQEKETIDRIFSRLNFTSINND